ncbi:MAG: PorV/PorQ family protein [Rhodothermales bacterium]|nr:PorV/PorQ family protein [Rhodothermales bacterium]
MNVREIAHYGSKVVVSALLFVGIGFQASGQESSDSPDRKITKVGTTSAQFLKLGVGARAISMGGSFVAEASDLSALYWNPAGLSGINGGAVQLAQTDYLADISYSYAAFGTSLGNMGTIAASIIFLDSGEMEVRTASEPEGTGERFKVQDMALQLSYGRALTDRFSIGTTIKYIRETIWHSSASAMAFDIGVLFTTPFEALRLGANMSNFGPKMQMGGRDILFSEDPSLNQEGNVEIVNSEFLTDEHPLPLKFAIGLAWNAFAAGDHRVTMMTDAAHPNDNSEYLNVGGEYSFRELLFLRGGYRNIFEEDGEEGVTFGGGLNLRIDRTIRVAFDYAYAEFGRLDQTHWFTVNLQF